MIGYYGYDMLLTYLNAVSAMFGVYFALNGDVRYAVICLIISGVCDAFDGLVARTKKNRTERAKSYGIQIDSLTDVAAFGVLPVIIGCSLLPAPLPLWCLAIISAYILAVLIRLAYFNATEIEMQRDGIKRTHYIGLPVTTAAVAVPLVFLLAPENHLTSVYFITLGGMSLLYLVKIRVSKVRPDEAVLKFLYNNAVGRAILSLLVKAFVSRLAGKILDSSVSRAFIPDFVKNHNIDMDDFRETEYRSFNDFFTREIKEDRRPFPEDRLALPSPCDGKLSAYRVTEDSLFRIKRSVYDINSLLKDSGLADEFMDGICLVFRLVPSDYHRYCFIDDGEILAHRKIKGELHTVRPIAHKRYKVYTQNAREYTVMRTETFGKVIQIEVGALFVGKISNRKTSGKFRRGEEKGMFEFGGSTVMLLLKKDAAPLCDKVFADTDDDKETSVKLGEEIGRTTRTEKGKEEK